MAQRIASILDVKNRHTESHPNLIPAQLFKKVFILERAMRQARHNDHEILLDLIRVVMSVTPVEDRTRYLEAWRAEGNMGWARYDPAQIKEVSRRD